MKSNIKENIEGGKEDNCIKDNHVQYNFLTFFFLLAGAIYSLDHFGCGILHVAAEQLHGADARIQRLWP